MFTTGDIVGLAQWIIDDTLSCQNLYHQNFAYLMIKALPAIFRIIFMVKNNTPPHI